MAVLNKHHHGGRVPPGAVDIMRGSPFGNPFRVGTGPGQYTRDQAVARYRHWLWRRIHADADFRAAVRSLHGRDLCCCCAPLPCHGDVLERAAMWLNEHHPAPAAPTP